MNTSSVETHGIVLHVNNNNVTYLDSFEVEHIPKAIKIHRQQKQIFTEYDPTIHHVWLLLYRVY